MCKSESAPVPSTPVLSTSVPSTPEEALAELIAGNERFANEKSIHPHVAEKIEKGELMVKAAYYDVKTGKVSIH